MRPKLLLLLLLSLVLAACRAVQDNDDELSGTVILWHGWSPRDTRLLEEVLDDYEEIHPGVSIVEVAVPAEELNSRYQGAAAEGLGPDLLLGNSNSIRELANSEVIRAIEPDAIAAGALVSGSLATTTYQGTVFGTPMSLFLQSLYYNRSLVEETPATLDELLRQAAEGKAIAFVPRFEEAYWGIQGFGQGLFDADGNFTLAESGFAEWLAWLAEAQNQPGVILNVDEKSLFDLFARGQLAYYVNGPEEQESLEAALGQDAFGVTTLPSGPEGPAGPLLSSEAIMLYVFSSPEQALIAKDLVDFLVDQQQSIRFMRSLGHVPANSLVTVDPRLYPTVAGFSEQAKTAVVLPNKLKTKELEEIGDRAYATVLRGSATPEQAVCRFGQAVIVLQEFREDQVSLPAGCPFPEKEPAS